jgi:hypothetical protein
VGHYGVHEVAGSTNEIPAVHEWRRRQKISFSAN